MRDVAERADVSVATVSHVVNETRPVSDALRERVLAAMDELGSGRIDRNHDQQQPSN